MRPHLNSYLFLVSFSFVMLTTSGCDYRSINLGGTNMQMLTPRLEPLFKNVKTICFGRFMIDVPESTVVVWGNTDIPLGVVVYPGGINEVKKQAVQFIDKLKSEKAIYHNHVPLLLAVDEVTHPEGEIVTGYEEFESLEDLKINGYFKIGRDDGVVIDSRPLREDKDRAISLIRSMANRVHQRAETEIPTTPGNCIEYAFLPDEPAPEKEPRAELVRIGFRLKEFPDTHLSIFVGPSNPHYSDSSSLKWRLERLENNLRAENLFHPRLKTRYLRRGERQIHDWPDGFEALSVTPDLPDAPSIHDFAMDFRGKPADTLRPFADIQMVTGVNDNVAGATKPSLTDEEALAVWDRITSTIRVRPTKTAAQQSAESSAPRFPLGELAATGRTCRQTGWWQSSESGKDLFWQKGYECRNKYTDPRVTAATLYSIVRIS